MAALRRRYGAEEVLRDAAERAKQPPVALAVQVRDDLCDGAREHAVLVFEEERACRLVGVGDVGLRPNVTDDATRVPTGVDAGWAAAAHEERPLGQVAVKQRRVVLDERPIGRVAAHDALLRGAREKERHAHDVARRT